jgi:hypothetical protein
MGLEVDIFLETYLISGIFLLQHPLEQPVEDLQHVFSVKDRKVFDLVLANHLLDFGLYKVIDERAKQVWLLILK